VLFLLICSLYFICNILHIKTTTTEKPTDFCKKKKFVCFFSSLFLSSKKEKRLNLIPHASPKKAMKEVELHKTERRQNNKNKKKNEQLNFF